VLLAALVLIALGAGAWLGWHNGWLRNALPQVDL